MAATGQTGRCSPPGTPGRYAALQALVGAALAAGHVTFAVGDSNFHGFRLPGLTSAWEGRPESPGTLGASRRVDDVFGPGPAAAVTLLGTASDHKAVLAARPDRA